jgi:1-deoxy-D-xylulose-5-phosphate reductoisomerase
MRSITILGSTGSIGTQALQIVSLYPERFQVVALSAHHNAALLFEQVRLYRPQMAALTGDREQIPQDLRFCDWYFGHDALAQLAALAPADDVLVSLSGMVGLRSVLAARGAGKRVLLANKEALVAGGSLVMAACPLVDGQPTLIPVDSEHSAVFQCLRAAEGNHYRRIILTASGGPFRSWNKEQIRNASPEQALKHPNWAMGNKITIDSASMFNKALEIIEARWLFDAEPEQLEVLIHPQSIVHSMVCFEDGAVLAQMGTPNMRIPILYAMGYPQRLDSSLLPLDLAGIAGLTFEKPDNDRFPAIGLAYQALRSGCGSACTLNAANEVAVAAFLRREIRFGAITDIVIQTMQALGSPKADSLEAIEESDRAARSKAQELIVSLRSK